MQQNAPTIGTSNAQRRHLLQRALLLSNRRRNENELAAQNHIKEIKSAWDDDDNDDDDKDDNPAPAAPPRFNDNWRLEYDNDEMRVTSRQRHNENDANPPPSPLYSSQPPALVETEEDDNDEQLIESEYERKWREQAQHRYATRFADRQALMAQREEKEKQAAAMWQYTRGQYAKIDNILAAFGLERVPIAADGNCLFHSFASYFDSKDSDHRFIRQKICDYIDQNRDKFQIDIECDWPSIDAYLKAMRRVGEWGDGIILNAFCLAYNINVVLITPDGSSEMYPGDNRSKMALVCYAKHYTATRVCNGTEKRLQ